MTDKKTKEMFIEILALLRGIAYDQATREFSGLDWFKEIDMRLNDLKELVSNSK